MTSAELCHRNGWKVGDVLEGDEGYGPTRIRLTAIGVAAVLAIHLDLRPGPAEGLWTLLERRWHKVEAQP